MSRLPLVCLPAVLLACLGCTASDRPPPAAPPPAAANAPSAKTSAKEFSMKLYYMVFIRRGAAWTAAETPEVKQVSAGHMANIQRMTRIGKMVLAGPFDVPEGAPADALAGIFLLNVPSMEEAVAVTQADPAVKAGRFKVDILPWYGPAGITYDGVEAFVKHGPEGK